MAVLSDFLRFGPFPAIWALSWGPGWDPGIWSWERSGSHFWGSGQGLGRVWPGSGETPKNGSGGADFGSQERSGRGPEGWSGEGLGRVWAGSGQGLGRVWAGSGQGPARDAFWGWPDPQNLGGGPKFGGRKILVPELFFVKM